MRQRLRAVGLFALAIVAITCTDAPTSPNKTKPTAPGATSIRMSPSFTPEAARIYSGLAAFGIEVTEVHIVLTGADGSIRDTVIAFPASQDQITIEIPVPSSATDQAFDALIELRNDQHVVLFSGHQIVFARAANLPTLTPPVVVITYTGPGKGTRTVTFFPADTTIAGTASVAVRATAVDSAGLAVPNPLVRFAVSDATLAVITQTGDATGTLTGLGKRGVATVSAITPTGITGSSRITFVPGAARIVVISGNGQTGLAGSALAQAVVVEVQATDNLPVPGAAVTFRAVTAGGSVQQATVIADANGRATTALTLGPIAGPYVFEAGSGALTPVSITATATAAPASAIAIVSGDVQTDTIGKTLAQPLVVRVTNQFGGPVAGATVSWTKIAGTGTPSAATTTTATDGTTSINYTLGATASDDTVRASVAGVTNGVLFSAKAVARGGVITVVAGASQSGGPGATLPPIVVRLVDAQNNPIANAIVTWSAAGAGVTFNPASSTTDTFGQASTTVTLGSTPGTTIITATVGTVTATTSLTTTGGGGGGQVTLSINAGDQQSALAGTVVPIDPSVIVKDGAGNPMANLQIIFTVASGGGTITGGTTATNTSGVATLGSWTLGSTPGPNTVTATFGSLSVTFTATAIVPTHFGFVQAPPAQFVVGGAPVTISVQLLDAQNAPVPQAGVVVTLAGTATPGPNFPTLQATTDATGKATFTVPTYNGATGSVSLAVSASGLTSLTSSSIPIVAGSATKLLLSTQPSATAVNNAPFAQQPVVQLADAAGNPVTTAGVVVTATVATGPSTPTPVLSNATATTDATGKATFAGLGINGGFGAYTLNFAATGFTSIVSNAITIGAGAANTLQLLGGNAQNASVGTAVAVPPSVKVIDAQSNGVSGVVVTFNAVTSGSTVSDGSTTGSTVTVTTNALGVAQLAAWTLGPVAGPNSLTASATVPSGSPVTFTATALAGGAAKFLPVQVPTSITVDSPIPPIVFQIADANNNPVAQSGVGLTLSLNVQPSNTTLVVTSTTNAQGIASFSLTPYVGTIGNATITVTGSGYTTYTSAPIPVERGNVTAIVLTTQPSASAQSGVPFAQQPVAQLIDAGHNPVLASGVPITVTTSSGTLSGTLAVSTNASGQAAFAGLALTGAVGPHTLTFSNGQLTPATSNPITISAGPASVMTILAGNGQSAPAGSNVPILPSVQVKDSFGNPVAGFDVLFTAVTPGSFIDDVQTKTIATDAQGIAALQFFWQLGPTVGTNTVTASATGVTGSPLTFTATGTAGTAADMRLLQPVPASITVGQPFPAPVQVQLVDQNNNPVPQAGVVITATANVQPSNTTFALNATTASNGIATFNLVPYVGTIGTMTFTLTAPNVNTLVTPGITVLAGSPNKLVITTQPAATAASGVAFTTQPVVQVTDIGSNPVNASANVAATIQSGSGTLNGTTTIATNTSGQASFSGLSLSGSPSSFTLRFSATGLTAVISNTIVLGVGAPAAMTIVAGDAQVVAAGTAVPTAPSVRVTDANGTALSGITVTFAPTLGGGSVTGASKLTNASGIATVDTWTLGTTPGTNNLTASVGALSTVITATAVAGPASKLAFITAPPASAASGAPLSPQPSVQRQDQFGNAVAGAGVTVTATVATGSGALTNATATTNAAGLATFSGLTITGTTGTLTLQFASAGVTSLVSSNIALGGGSAAAITKSAGDNQTAAAGTNVPVAPSVLLSDAAGNPVSGAQVFFQVATGGGTVVGSPVTTNASGIATISSWRLGNVVGANSMTATFGSLSTTFNATSITGPATQLAFVTAPPTSAASGAPLSPQPSVQRQDQFGNPVAGAGVAVTATVATGSGTLTNAAATTNAAGLATFAGLTISGPAGTLTLQFASAGVTSVVSPGITLGGGAAAAITKSAGDNQTAAAGANVAVAPAVTIADGAGNPVVGAQVTFTVTTGNGSVTGSPATTNASGVATLGTWRLGNVVGANSITATLGALSTTFNATSTTGPAAQLALITAPPATASSGTALNPQPSVQVQDQFGNPVAGAGAAITASLLSGTGTVSNAIATTNAAGLATFSALTISGPTGQLTLQFNSPNVATAVSATINLGGGAAALITKSAGDNQTAAAGANVAVAPAVTVTDGAGNPVVGAQVTFAVASGAGSVTGTPATTNASGVATLGSWRLGNTVGANSITATLGALSATFNATAIAGPASQLTFVTAPPASASSGSALTPQPSVQRRDQFGNPVAGAGVTVTATVATGSGALSNATATTNAAGLATFSGLTITGTAGNLTLQFASAGVTSLVSPTIALGGGAAAAINKTAGDNQTATAGSNVAIAPAVTVTDGSGNPLGGVQVTFAVATGGGSVSGTPATTNASGVATLGSWTLGTAVGANSITATVGALTTTFNASAIGGTASQLAFVQAPPATAASGTALTPQPSVQLRDQFGNNVASAGVTVTATIASGSATLTNATATTNAAGLAAFSGLTISGQQGTVTLQFSSAGLAPAVSSSINLSAGAAAIITKTSGDNQTADAGTTLPTPPSVLVTDGAGNPLQNVQVTFTVASGGGSVTGSPTTTNADGLAGVSWTLGTAVGANTMTASVGALSTTFNATAVAGPPAQFAFITAPPTTATSGVALSPQPSVQLQDNFGNPVGLSGVNVDASFLSGNGSLTNSTATTNASGLATFSGLAIIGAAQTLTLQFGNPSYTHAVSNPITLSAGAAANIAKTAGDLQSATVGTAVATDPQVTVTDGAGNPVAGATVTFTVASGNGSVTGTPATTNASGVATVGSWQLGNIVGGNSLTATTGALSTTFTATGTAAAPAALTFNTQPPTTASSTVPLSPQPIIQLVDAFGNATGGAGVTVTAVITSGTGALSNATATTVTGGLASFSGLAISGSGSFTLQFQSGSLSPIQSQPITIAAGPAANIVFSVQPSGATGGVPFSPTVAVRLVDGQGNTVTNNTNTVTLSIAPGSGTTGATLAGAGPVTFVNGVATFPSAAIDFGGTNYALRANTNALNAAGAPIAFATSNVFNITPGPSQSIIVPLGRRISVASVGAANPPTGTRPVFVARNAQGNVAPGLSLVVTAYGRCRLDIGTASVTTSTYTTNSLGEVTPIVVLPTGNNGSGCTIKATGPSFTTSSDSSKIAVFPVQTSHVWTGMASSSWTDVNNWIAVISSPNPPQNSSDNLFLPNYNPAGVPVIPIVSGPKPVVNRVQLDTGAFLNLNNIGIDVGGGGVLGFGFIDGGATHMTVTAPANGIFDVLDIGQAGCGQFSPFTVSLRNVTTNVLNVHCRTRIDTTVVGANTVNIFPNAGQGWLQLAQSRAALSVTGNANFTGDSLVVNGGIISVGGTTTLGGRVTYTSGTLSSTGAATFASTSALYNGTQIVVQGNATFGGPNAGAQQFAGGQMNLLGNFSQVQGVVGGPGALTFSTMSDHITVFNGSTPQTVSFQNPTQSRFSILRVLNTSAGGVQLATFAQIINGTTQPRVDILQGRLQINSGQTFTVNSGGLKFYTAGTNLNLLGNIAGVGQCTGKTTNGGTITGPGLFNGTAYASFTCDDDR